MLRQRARFRAGVAAVEVAVVTAFLLAPLLIGLWEIGRAVQVKQVVSNSAREGARRAAQGYTVNSTGIPTQVTIAGGNPDVTSAVYQYLYAAGFTNLQPSDVTVTFQFVTPRSDGQPATEPFQGEKGQPFTVTVTVPWNKVRWVNLGLIQPDSISFTATWQMVMDEPFTINTNLPTW